MSQQTPRSNIQDSEFDNMVQDSGYLDEGFSIEIEPYNSRVHPAAELHFDTDH